MNCPHRASSPTKQQIKKTSLGYRTFRCSACQRTFNERTGTPFNFLEYPTDVVLLVVLWRLRYKLSLRDLSEMFLERGIVFTHETVRDWEARFAPLMADQLRRKRRGQAGRSWYVDETYIKVHGKWCYLYRAIDQDGNLVDSMLSDEEWAFVAPYLMLLPEDAGQRTHGLREVFNGLRWIVRAGARLSYDAQ